MKRIVLIVSIFTLSLISCTQTESPVEETPVDGERVMIYQVMTRLFGNTETANIPWGTIEENGVGKFSDINEAALKGLKDLGITHVWYTGVLEHATITDYSEYGIPNDFPEVIKGRAGSPYSIKDYYDVNPFLADSVDNRVEEFVSLIDRTHEHGMKVLIDFVPNHVARVYQSDMKPEGIPDLGENDDNSVAFSPSNNFYYLQGEEFVVPEGFKPLGERTPDDFTYTYSEIPAKATGSETFRANPSIDDWFEAAKLNYGIDYQQGGERYFDPIPDTWIRMKEILLHWAAKGVDGFRCDMAQLVPVEFWNWLVTEVKNEYPETIFVAEIYVPEWYDDYISIGKFDYLYDKVLLYDTLRNIVHHGSPAQEISGVRTRLDSLYPHLLNFLENHDEQRIASPDFAGDPFRALPAMTVSATLGTGPVMIYFGQEVGEPGKEREGFQGDDGRTTIFDFWGVPEHQKWMNGGSFDGGGLSDDQRKLRGFYSDLLNLCNSKQALISGDYVDLGEINAGNYSDKVFAFLRQSNNQRILVVVNFGDSEEAVTIQLPDSTDITANGLLNDSETIDLNAGSLQLNLSPFSSHIFELIEK